MRDACASLFSRGAIQGCGGPQTHACTWRPVSAGGQLKSGTHAHGVQYRQVVSSRMARMHMAPSIGRWSAQEWHGGGCVMGLLHRHRTKRIMHEASHLKSVSNIQTCAAAWIYALLIIPDTATKIAQSMPSSAFAIKPALAINYL